MRVSGLLSSPSRLTRSLLLAPPLLLPWLATGNSTTAQIGETGKAAAAALPILALKFLRLLRLLLRPAPCAAIGRRRRATARPAWILSWILAGCRCSGLGSADRTPCLIV